MSKDLEDRITALESRIVNYETELNRIKSLVDEHNKVYVQTKINQKTLKESLTTNLSFETECKDCNDNIDEECY